jgi:hypothetical protein
MLSSIVDTDSTNPPTPATWVTAGHATPIERYAGLAHVDDTFYRKIRANWNALGLDALGPAVDASTARAPYGDTHQLVISEPAGLNGLSAHASTGNDLFTPTAPDGTPVLAPVWEYLLHTAAGR